MHPIFIAHGPAFKKNYTSTPFNIVDIYPLMCHILRVPPHPNDGNLANIRHILLDEGGSESADVNRTSVTSKHFFVVFMMLKEPYGHYWPYSHYEP